MSAKGYKQTRNMCSMFRTHSHSNTNEQRAKLITLTHNAIHQTTDANVCGTVFQRFFPSGKVRTVASMVPNNGTYPIDCSFIFAFYLMGRNEYVMCICPKINRRRQTQHHCAVSEFHFVFFNFFYWAFSINLQQRSYALAQTTANMRYTMD